MDNSASRASARFEQDHRICDELFADAEQRLSDAGCAAAVVAFRRFMAALERHFSTEEACLFPQLEQAAQAAAGPVQVMRREHTQMRQLMQALEAALLADDAGGFAANAEILVVLMQQHNLKEENILYPMCDRALSGAAVQCCSDALATCCEPS